MVLELIILLFDAANNSSTVANAVGGNGLNVVGVHNQFVFHNCIRAFYTSFLEVLINKIIKMFINKLQQWAGRPGKAIKQRLLGSCVFSLIF